MKFIKCLRQGENTMIEKLNIRLGIEQEVMGLKSRLLTGTETTIEEIAEKINELIEVSNAREEKDKYCECHVCR